MPTECKAAEARIAYVKEAGFEFTLDEIKEITSELTDEMLDSVAGGLWSVWAKCEINSLGMYSK